MFSIRISTGNHLAVALAVFALSIAMIAVLGRLGPDVVASALLDHLGTQAAGTGREPVPGLTAACYAAAIRAITKLCGGSRRRS